MHIYIKIKRFQVGGTDQNACSDWSKIIKYSFLHNVRQSHKSKITQIIGHIQFILLAIIDL